MTSHTLEDRLIDFLVAVINLSEDLKKSYAGKHLEGQLVRSGTSPALNYGEARSAESPKDFQHKMGISLKELRETFNTLRIIKRANLYTKKEQDLDKVLTENNELISIFVASIRTSKKNMR